MMCVARSALSRHAVHRTHVSLGADVAIATSSLGEYCFIIGAIAMVRQASRCHLIPLPRPPLALQTPRPSADPCHGLEPAQVRMPITWASPAGRARGNQPPGPGREARGGGRNLQRSVEGEDKGGRLQQANCREVWEDTRRYVCAGWGTQGFQSREFTDNEGKLEQIFSRQSLTGQFEIGEG